MKIWYQSGAGYRYYPLWEEYGKTLEQQCKRAARPDTEVFITGNPMIITERDRYKSVMYYHSSQFMNSMLQAEAEGYDAFVIGCSFDERMDEGREMLSMPVISIGQANLFLAAMFGEWFAITTCEPHIAQRYDQLVRKYGLESKYLRGPYIFPISENQLAGALKNPEKVAEGFKAVAKKAVADGASVIIPVPASIYQMFYKTNILNSDELQGATVLDPVAVVIKFAEMMVDLKKIGIEVSRTLQVSASLGKKLREELLNAYAPIFKINIPKSAK
ncbi:MAG TPA: aspartate/glutamate racemase family protein [Dehalococcoidales bacterium]|nr:aspartate/glutamate racemase family protein [Dehalococcoidales bacterium]